MLNNQGLPFAFYPSVHQLPVLTATELTGERFSYLEVYSGKALTITILSILK